jgi:hypothetical protein
MGEYREAPMLAQMVAAGELPAVGQRLPKNPSVWQPLEELGPYGGALRVFGVDPNPWNDLTESTGRGGGLLRVAPDGSIVGISPNALRHRQTKERSRSGSARASSGRTALPLPRTTSCSCSKIWSGTRR